MSAKALRRMTMRALSAESGLKPAQIRYLIVSGLIPPANGTGRGAHYSDEHLNRLERLKPYYEEGWTAQQLRSFADAKALDKPREMGHRRLSVFSGFALADGIQCLIDRAVADLTLAQQDQLRDQLQRHTSRFLRTLGKTKR